MMNFISIRWSVGTGRSTSDGHGSHASCAAAQPPGPVLTRRRHDRAPTEVGFRAVLLACLAVGIVFLVVLLAYVLIEGWPRLDADLFGTRRPSSTATAGAQAAILGTLWLMAGTAIIALPIGVLAAVYLEEYADRERWYNRLIELNIQISPPCRAWCTASSGSG